MDQKTYVHIITKNKQDLKNTSTKKSKSNQEPRVSRYTQTL